MTAFPIDRGRAILASRGVIAAAGLLLLATGAASPEEPKLPVIEGKKALASVNGEAVTLGEFLETVTKMQEGATSAARRPQQDPWAVLDRLISGKLVVQEARNIGLNERADVLREVDLYRRETIQQMLLDRQVQGITRPDPAAALRLYKTMAGEAKIESVLFEKENAALNFEAKVKGGADFSATVKDAVGHGNAKTSPVGEYIKLSEAVPSIAGAIVALQPGQVSTVIRVEGGFTLVKLLDLRVPENQEGREKAEREALNLQRLAVLGRYTQSLVERYARIDRKFWEGLDFEAPKPGFDVLKTDSRAVAAISGGPAITVADVAKAMEEKFFHGKKRAIEKKRVNHLKPGVLHDLLVRRMTLLEGARLGLDKSLALKQKVADYEEGLLFGAFVKKVIAPDVQVEDAEAKTYYEQHRADYSTPEMLRIESLAFKKKADAADAVAKLQSGADFQWLRQNTGGQISLGAGEDELQLEDGLVVTSMLPEGLQKAVARARSGDARAWGEAPGPYYALLIRDVVPPKPADFETVRAGLVKKLAAEKTKKTLDDWAAKLRAASDVRVFVTPDQLQQVIKREAGKGA